MATTDFLSRDELFRRTLGDLLRKQETVVEKSMKETLLENVPRCPWCRSTRIAADVLEDGTQASPLECEDCGAHQANDQHDPALLATMTDEEKARGWWRGHEHRDALDPAAPPPPPVVKCRDCRRSKEERDRQEARFNRAKTDYEQAAKRMLDKHAEQFKTIAQQERVINQLRADVRDADSRADRRRAEQDRAVAEQRDATTRELTATKAELEKVRKELADIRATIRTPEPEGTSRFALLDVD